MASHRTIRHYIFIFLVLGTSVPTVIYYISVIITLTLITLWIKVNYGNRYFQTISNRYI